MKKAALALVLGMLLSVSAFAQVEVLRSEGLKKLIASSINEYDLTWESEDLGKIWVVNYFDFDDGTGWKVKGQPERYLFTVSDRSRGQMTLNVQFPCGSENDESELQGSCDVTLIKGAIGKWKSVIKACSCF